MPLESDSEDEPLEHKEGLPLAGEATPSRFHSVDPGELANVMAGGKRRSKNTENWAENAFNEWRECNGYSTKASIADLSVKSDVKPLVETLSMFMVQVNKKDDLIHRCIHRLQGQELPQVEDNQFVFCKDNFNEPFLRYIPRLAKNWKIDIVHCSTVCQWNSETCHDPDDILTFQTMFKHRPCFLPSKPGPHPLFLTPKSKLKNDNVWFMKSPVGNSSLSNMTKDMAMEVDVLKNKRITNKTERSVGISRMVDANVPFERAMERTGHRSPKGFLQYDRTAKSINDRALSGIISGNSNAAVGLSYTSLYEDERAKLLANLVNEAAVQEKSTAGCLHFDKHALGLSKGRYLFHRWTRNKGFEERNRCGFCNFMWW